MSKKIASSNDDEEDKKKKKKLLADEKLRQSMLENLKRQLGMKADDESLHSADKHVSITDVISTGHTYLDQLLTPDYFKANEVGGVPRGFLIEFYGPNAGGKSSLCLKLAAQATKKDGHVLWMDAEGCFMTEWADANGVNRSNVLIYHKPGATGEEYIDSLETFVASGLFSLAVIDSMEALTPKVLLEGNLEDPARVGAKAQLMSRCLPRIVSAAKKGNTAVVFINQIRNKIGGYGNPETTPGGEALRFYASLRLRISQVGNKDSRSIMKDGEEIGIRSDVMIKKSRFGPPFKSTVLPIYYRSDLKPHPLDIILDVAMECKAITTRAVKPKHGKEDDITMYLTFAPEDEKGVALPGWDDLKRIEGIDNFKALLTKDRLNFLVKYCQEKKKANFDPEVSDYLKQLELDPTSNDTLSGTALEPMDTDDASIEGEE